ncbi:MAG: hypothetical protein M0Z61_08650 [Nitrospiraceae bacterium]|nr:hypothetical protein [Nitrospiraceae bacterium]
MNKKRVGGILLRIIICIALSIILSGCGSVSQMEAAAGLKKRIPTGQVNFINATSPGNGKVYLTWGAAANATAYDVYRQVTNSQAWPGNGTALVSINQTAYTDTVKIGVVNSAYYWVVPVDNIGLEGYFDTRISVSFRQGCLTRLEWRKGKRYTGWGMAAAAV